MRSPTATACAASAGRAPPGTAGRPTGNAAPSGVRPRPAAGVGGQAVLKATVPAAEPQPPLRRIPPHPLERRSPLLVLTVSLVLLLGVLVWFLVRFAGLRGWHALLCVLFGFSLASTPLAPYIQTGCSAIARLIAEVGF